MQRIRNQRNPNSVRQIIALVKTQNAFNEFKANKSNINKKIQIQNTLSLLMEDRNIILFFEENEDHKEIANRMVRLYMNRFTIDEDERFEINGVRNLSKALKRTHENWETYIKNYACLYVIHTFL